MNEMLTIVDHPLVTHKLSLMRATSCGTQSFRRLLREISPLLAYEALRDLPMTQLEVETPLETIQTPVLEGKKPALISILRAGNGLLDGFIDVMPGAKVGFVGLYRDPETLRPVQYYYKVPKSLSKRLTVVVDPMLATGNSAVAAIDLLKADGAHNIRLVCLLAAPEGVAEMQARHPDVKVITAALDRELNDHGYIVPGLGDAGDRVFGTG